MKCLMPIKVYDSYVACGQCANCKIDKNRFSLYNLHNMCEYQKLQEKLKPSRKENYKKWWKRYVKIQKKIAVLNLKIKKLKEKYNG